MNCLDHGQLLWEALGLETDEAAGAHLENCADCRELRDTLGQLPRRFVEQLDQGAAAHGVARQRLLDALPERRPEQEAVDSIRFPRLIGTLIMRHRLAFGSLSLAIVAVLVLRALPWSQPLTALAQTSVAMRQVRSFQADWVVEAAAPIDAQLRGRSFWLAGEMRDEVFDGDKVISVRVSSKKRAGIAIDHRSRTYHRTNVIKGNKSPLTSILALSNATGEADEELGEKQIGNVKAKGFRIAANKVDSDLIDGGTMTVWVDPDTKLPVLFEMADPRLGTMRMSNFRWNLELDDALFTPPPPEGYTNVTRKSPQATTQVDKIVDALRTYAEAFDGQYPPVKNVYGDVTSARLKEKLGIPAGPTSEQEVAQHPAFEKYLAARHGFAALNVIQRQNAESGYFGKTVGPQDSDKIVFYWRLGDGTYQVLYGDLKTTVIKTQAELREQLAR